jgi:hypothetical protein
MAKINWTEAQLKQYQAKPGVEPPKRRPSKPKPVAQPHADRAVRSVCFEFPLPPTGCGQPRGSSHWLFTQGPRADYRKECNALLSKVSGPLFQKALIRAEFFHAPAAGRYHAKDESNAISGIKALVDSLVDCGYLPDDSAAHLHWDCVTLHGAKESGNRACVVVTLTRA